MRSLKSVFLVLAISLGVVSGCDILAPKRAFRLAVPERDYYYNYLSTHLIPFFQEAGYRIMIVPADNAVQAAEMVANGEADLTLFNNHSSFIASGLQGSASNLRSILPISTRLFFMFSKEKLAQGLSLREIVHGRTIGLEVLNGEMQQSLEHFFERAKIGEVEYVHRDDNPDLMVFWGTMYGERVQRLLDTGWHEVQLTDDWIDFIALNHPSLERFELPPVPGEPESLRLKTLSTQVLLVGNKMIGENAIYELVRYTLQHRLDLISQDATYASMNEGFDKSEMLFPIHHGTISYLSRDQPTIFERYSDFYALLLSIAAIIYGAIQTLRMNMRNRKKDRIDKYFGEFLAIRSDKSLAIPEKTDRYDDLLQNSLQKLIENKLEKGDFHILSRLIQQDLANLKSGYLPGGSV